MLRFDVIQCTDSIQPIRGSLGYHLADRGQYGLDFMLKVHQKSFVSMCLLDLFAPLLGFGSNENATHLTLPGR